MNKYKITIVEKELYIVDILAKTEKEAKAKAIEAWNNGDHQETGDIETKVDDIYNVTHTDDPFYPVNNLSITN